MSARTRLAALAALVLLAGGCAQGDDPAPPAAAPVEATTTTTGPPVALGVARSLDLQVGQCYAPMPSPPPEEPSTPTVAPGSAPVPPTVAVPSMIVADCAGPHTARVYAAFCLGAGDDRVLMALECPVAPGQPWPGDREVRRAAVRLCLERFEQVLGEPYATTTRTAFELTPTEGAWSTGEHRVVCAATEPEA